MMKSRFILGSFLLLLFSLGSISGQDNVVILVDVSGSGPDLSVKYEAREIVRQLCLGTYDQALYPDWTWAEESSQPITDIITGRNIPLLDPNRKDGGFLMIMPAGLKNTYRNQKMQHVKTLQTDFKVFFDRHYPDRFNEALTFIDVARAMAASYMKSQPITGYYLLEVSDGLYDTGSRSPGYSNSEQQAISAYGSSNSDVTKLGTLYYRGQNAKNYQIVVSRINLNQLRVNPSQPDSNQVAQKSLEVVRPNTTNRREPQRVQGTYFNVLWNCLGCSDDALFTVRANYVSRSGRRVPPVSVQSKSNDARLAVKEPGLYKIVVSTPGATGKPVYIEVAGSGDSAGSGLLWLLLLLGLAGGLYYYFAVRSKNAPRPKPNAETDYSYNQNRTGNPPAGKTEDNSSSDELF